MGQLVKTGVFKGRDVKPQLKCGICGEHGGDPASVEFCHFAGLNYVSCSPFRVPIAWLAAAHAALSVRLPGSKSEAVRPAGQIPGAAKSTDDILHRASSAFYE